MVKKEGKIPANARIDVDYTGGKPKIKFGYPGKTPMKDARKQQSIGWHSLFVFFVVLYFASIVLMPNDEPYPMNCNTTYIMDNEGTEINKVSKVRFDCDEGSYTVYFKKIGEPGSPPGFYRDAPKGEAREFLAFFFFFFFLGFVLNYVISYALIRMDWYAKQIPIRAAGGKKRRKDYMKFKPKDVFENMVIIPHFHNVELDYKTSGDFSDQLKHIRIRERRWHKWRPKRKKNKVSKLKTDKLDWHAVFYFKDKPKNGFLEVFYQ